MSGHSLNQEELNARIAAAIADGFDVVRAEPDTLLLDLDSAEQLTQFAEIYPIVDEYFGPCVTERWLSKSKRTHMRVKLAHAQPWAVRYALQSALGSDPTRDVLSVVQMLNGCDEASMLFRPKPVTGDPF